MIEFITIVVLSIIFDISGMFYGFLSQILSFSSLVDVIVAQVANVGSSTYGASVLSYPEGSLGIGGSITSSLYFLS